uniref:Uncharacterized protein n=1 Tax=viral metagenome TaxID=1070528 RepID=A0A6M3INX6_9ZZZZ
MKKKVVGIFIMALILGLMFGCAANVKDQFAYGTQGTLSTTLGTYKLINNTFTDLRVQGLITDEGWAQYDKMANKFLDEHIKVSKAMAAYKRGETTASAVDVAIGLMQEALRELRSYYISTIPKDKQQPLF